MKYAIWCVLQLGVFTIACTEVQLEENKNDPVKISVTEKLPDTISSAVHVKVVTDVPDRTRKDIRFAFGGGFRDDQVIFKRRGRILFQDSLTTDNRIAYASGMTLRRAYTDIQVVFNGDTFVVEVPSGFQYCLVNKTSDTLQFSFTNIQPLFR